MPDAGGRWDSFHPLQLSPDPPPFHPCSSSSHPIILHHLISVQSNLYPRVEKLRPLHNDRVLAGLLRQWGGESMKVLQATITVLEMLAGDPFTHS